MTEPMFSGRSLLRSFEKLAGDRAPAPSGANTVRLLVVVMALTTGYLGSVLFRRN